MYLVELKKLIKFGVSKNLRLLNLGFVKNKTETMKFGID